MLQQLPSPFPHLWGLAELCFMGPTSDLGSIRLALNTLRPRQNGLRSADDTFKRIFLNENVRISIKISLKFVPKCPINNITALVQIMAWRRSGDKPLSEPMMVSLLTHICITRPQWVNTISTHPPQEGNFQHVTCKSNSWNQKLLISTLIV